MIILGISCYFHDASAALISDGQLIAAAEEERFTRIKHDYSYPTNAIEFCLKKASIDASDIDYVVFFEKPFTKFERLLKTAIQGFPKTYWMFAQSMRTWLFDKLWIKGLISDHLKIDPKNIMFSEHHISHAASAYYCSPFKESAILTFDGVGEWATTTIGKGTGGKLEIEDEIHFPHSLGLLYSAFTAFLGFEVNEGEYKVMGMAPYGKPKYVSEVYKIIRINEDNSFWLDQKYLSFHYSTKKSFTKKMTQLFGEPRDANIPFFTKSSGYPSYFGDKPSNFEELSEYNQHYADIAASIQIVAEEMILELATEACRRSGSNNLCLAGGVALNSVANGRILRETPVENLYIQPAAGDGGCALGAALYLWHDGLGNSENRFIMDHAYWGEEYNDDQISKAIDSSEFNAQYINNEDDLLDMTVDRLTSGKVIGRFNGRFEWGPRSLGNRSILADPRSNEMKDLVNTKIKFREPFRPFAPSALAEIAESYFELPNATDNMAARFMLLVTNVHEDKQDLIPAVSHMGTARVQTVYKETNSSYYNLIERFGQSTGVPILLNTSFNVRGEPIVSSPNDALNTFRNSGIDTLVIGNHIVDKP
ncbi:MAG: carbamoyltransferase [SAR202 cluster bacterium]|nr:carbamoyltransferase [SAR202 cluster bacterium]